MIEALSLLKGISTEPYPGLRPFQANESHLFFGRDAQVEKLLEKIQSSHFVAVIGPSGCGKSSLVKAGLLPDLKRGFLIEEGCKCRTIDMHPGDKPFDNLAKALQKSLAGNTAIGCIKAELKRSPRGLVEAIKSERAQKNEIILLVVDQFEELFRYKQNNNIDEVIAFIALLIESANQRELSIHIVTTMRSDFLGECSLFPGLPEILNDNQFLTPRLTREQLKEAIEAPALVCGGMLEPFLVNTLLNDVGVDHDQLPLLQHALMRMWSLAKANAPRRNLQPDIPLDELKAMSNHQIVLDIDNYIAIGRLNKALTEHARQAYDKLDEKQKIIAEIIFRRLSERNAEQKDVRRPCSVAEIAKVATVNDAEVIAVAKIFIDPEYNFLTASDECLTSRSFLDISHESIIRQWDKMRDWITREYEAATRYKRLIADAKDHKAGTKELLSGIGLQNVLQWREKNSINEAWALRYSDPADYKTDFQLVNEYINASKAAEETAIEREKQKQVRSKNWKYSTIGGFVVLIFAIGIISFKSRLADQAAKLENKIEKARTDVERKNGKKIQDQFDRIVLQNNEIQAKNKEIQAQNKEIQKTNADLEDKKLKLEHLTANLTSQNYQLKIKTITSDIQDLPFYSKLDAQGKTLAIRELLPLYMVDSTNPKLKSLNRDFTALVTIQDTFIKTDPAQKFRELQTIWSRNKTALAASLIAKIANGNLFYKQKMNFSDYDFFENFLMDISSDKQFAISNNYSNFVGKYLNDSLIADWKFNSSLENTMKNDSLFDNALLSIMYKNGKLMRLDDSGSIIEYHSGGRKTIAKLPYIDQNHQYKISPNSEYIISAPKMDSIDAERIFKDRNIRLWKLPQPGNDSIVKSEILASNYSGVKDIVFSPDGSRVLFLFNKFRLEEWVIGQNNSRKFDIAGIEAANFTSDGKNLVTISTRGTARFLDLSGQTTDFRNMQLPVYDYQTVAVSPDLKRLIVKRSQGLMIYERSENDSIFKKELKGGKLMPKVFSTKESLVQAEFLNSNSIIATNNTGQIYLWKTYPAFADADAALATIQVPSLGNKMLLKDSLYFNRLLSSSDAVELDSVAIALEAITAEIEESEKYIVAKIHLKKIYKRLVQLSSGDKKTEYENRVISLNEELVDEEKNFGELNYDVAVRLVPRMKENIAIKEARLRESDPLALKDLSDDYWNLSWYQLFEKDFKGAISSVDKGLQLHPANDGMNTNKALGLLLSKQYDEAEALYRAYKGKKYTNQTRQFTTSFLQDFDDLTDAGIIKSSDKELYSRIVKIKEFLRQ